MLRKQGDQAAKQHRAGTRQQGDLIGGDVARVQAFDQWSQEVLEGRFELVDGHHRSRSRPGREQVQGRMAPGKGAERHQWLQRYAEATVEEIPAVLLMLFT
ncbi:hypothetical protein D3C84_704210 [compost metagenome]